MQKRVPRRLIAAAVLVIACGALIATTPGAPTASVDAAGEIAVAPGEAGEVEVRFTVADPDPDEITAMRIFSTGGGRNDPRVSTSFAASVVGDSGPAASGGGPVDLDPEACRSGCEVVATIDARWAGEEELGLRMAWTIELDVVYESRVPADAVSVSVVIGGESGLPRLTWPATGLLLAIAGAVGLRALGSRFAVARLVLAGGLLLPAAWMVLQLVSSLGPLLAGRLLLSFETLLILGAAAVLGVGTIIGLWRAATGRVTVLRVIGWMAAPALGFVWWLVAEALATYRPHEVVLLTLLLALPVTAAITAVPVGRGAERERDRIGVGTSLVIGAQGLMAAASFAAAIGAVLALVGSLVGGGRAPDLASLGLVIVTVVVASQYVIGVRAWRRGKLLPLLVANAPVALVVILAGIWTLAQPAGGFLTVGVELRVAAALAIATVLTGVVGLGVVSPPLADEQGDEQGRERDEVGGVADEGDRDGPGNIA